MSSPGTIKTEFTRRRIAAAARGNPGATQGGVRPKLQSIALDGNSWSGGQTAVRPRQQRRYAPFPVKLLLPQIIFQTHDLRQSASLLADFTCVILNFIAISELKAICNFLLTRNHFLLNRPLLAFPTSGIFLIYGVVLILLGYAERLYHADTIREPREQKIILARVVVWSSLLAGFTTQFAGARVISFATLGAASLLNFVTMLGWRAWWRERPKGPHSGRNVLIAGAGAPGRGVADWLKRDPSCGRVVVGFLDNHGPAGGDILGRIEELSQVARAKFVDEIIVALPQQDDLARMAIREARRKGLDIKLVADFHGCAPERASIENCGEVSVLTLQQDLIPEVPLFLKRAVDVMVAAAALILVSPALAAIAVVIKLDSPGPALYRAIRVGKKGRRFLCHKFRTMAPDAEARKELLRARNERQGACFKISDDPRITRVGRFLRRYSLDELPQLWNVLCGDMSLVGPRPHPLDDFEKYGLEDLRRLEVTPGITGLWQVTARRDPSFQRNVALDVEYIERWNLWMDLRILYKTVAVVWQGTGV